MSKFYSSEPRNENRATSNFTDFSLSSLSYHPLSTSTPRRHRHYHHHHTFRRNIDSEEGGGDLGDDLERSNRRKVEHGGSRLSRSGSELHSSPSDALQAYMKIHGAKYGVNRHQNQPHAGETRESSRISSYESDMSSQRLFELNQSLQETNSLLVGLLAQKFEIEDGLEHRRDPVRAERLAREGFSCEDSYTRQLRHSQFRDPDKSKTTVATSDAGVDTFDLEVLMYHGSHDDDLDSVTTDELVDIDPIDYAMSPSKYSPPESLKGQKQFSEKNEVDYSLGRAESYTVLYRNSSPREERNAKPKNLDLHLSLPPTDRSAFVRGRVDGEGSKVSGTNSEMLQKNIYSSKEFSTISRTKLSKTDSMISNNLNISCNAEQNAGDKLRPTRRKLFAGDGKEETGEKETSQTLYESLKPKTSPGQCTSRASILSQTLPTTANLRKTRTNPLHNLSTTEAFYCENNVEEDQLGDGDVYKKLGECASRMEHLVHSNKRLVDSFSSLTVSSNLSRLQD